MFIRFVNIEPWSENVCDIAAGWRTFNTVLIHRGKFGNKAAFFMNFGAENQIFVKSSLYISFICFNLSLWHI